MESASYELWRPRLHTTTMDCCISNYSVQIPETSQILVAPPLVEASSPSSASCVQFIFVAILLRYTVALARYHLAHRTQEEGQLPPKYPFLIPFFGILFPFLWDNEGFFRHVTCYKGSFSSTRVTVLGHHIHLFQDRETIKKIWRAPALSSPMSISLYTFKYFFGVPEKTLAVYRADTSGPCRKPYPETDVPADKRIDYLSHQEFLRALSGPGLPPTFRRFQRALEVKIDELGVSNEWTDVPDFRKSFQNIVGSPLVEAIYGPELLRLNPDFVDDLYEFDANVPWLARGFPSFVMPSAHRARKRLGDQIRKWYSHARQQFTESSIYEDGDGDPFWGSQFTRNRHAMFSRVGDHDDDARVALDIGLCFGLVANTSPAALLAVWHIYKDPVLLQRIRTELHDHLGSQSIRDINPKELMTLPLLQSVYAETLRLYTKIYIMVSSSQADVGLGRWRLPKDSIGLLNSSMSHHDAKFWNTKDGLHPVDTFWADRFLIDPNDPSSGPINPAVHEGPSSKMARQTIPTDGKPFFSTHGLEASWFPYGGGYSICPGRHLAKNVIILTCAILAAEFDVEFVTESLVLDKWRFGIGLAAPKNALPFRIKRRHHPRDDIPLIEEGLR